MQVGRFHQKMCIACKLASLLLLATLIHACGNGNRHITVTTESMSQDYTAKQLLQGIWINEETESPLLYVYGDTIIFANALNRPMSFKIIKNTLHIYGNDTIYYKINKQTEFQFWFHSMFDDIIKLYKSDDPNDITSFTKPQKVDLPVYTEVTKFDSVITYNSVRYHIYTYVNPTQIKVIKTTYSDEGIGVDNVFYDNIIFICIYEGNKRLFNSNITRQMFEDIVPQEFLTQSILSDIKFDKITDQGFHYQAYIAIPESSVYNMVEMVVDFEYKLNILPAD